MSSHANATLTWSVQEQELFLQGLETHGKGNWKLICKNFVKTRTLAQVASHAQKHFLRIARRDAKASFKPKKPRTPRPCPPRPCPPTPCPPTLFRPLAKLPALPCPLGSMNERLLYYAPLVSLLNNQLLAHEQKGAALRAQLHRAKFLAGSGIA